jgi:hypothetical protein
MPSSRAPAEAGASILDRIEAASPILFVAKSDSDRWIKSNSQRLELAV